MKRSLSSKPRTDINFLEQIEPQLGDSWLSDELESSWHRMLLLSDQQAAGKTAAFRARLRRQLIGKVRDDITEAGAGKRMPEFRKSTKQN